MSELPTHSLTNLTRVKNRLTLDTPAFDAVLERMIGAVTDRVEGECNRRFKSTTYTSEVYSYDEGTQRRYVFLNQTPVTALTSLSYRAGTPSNPSWTAFGADDYELMGDGKSGLVRVYGGIPRGVNTVRATYTAGYLIDWDNITDTTKHTLPFDLTDLCERMVVKEFKKRESEGRSAESFEGGSVTWEKLLNDDDKEIVNRYRRAPTF